MHSTPVSPTPKYSTTDSTKEVINVCPLQIQPINLPVYLPAYTAFSYEACESSI